MSHREFTYEQIAATFSYDPHTGELFRRMPDGEVRAVKMVNGTDERSYSAQIKLQGHRIIATHVCFMLMEHRWPLLDHYINHRDRDVFNCRWANLWEATPRQSSMNNRYHDRPSRKPDDF